MKKPGIIKPLIAMCSIAIITSSCLTSSAPPLDREITVGEGLLKIDTLFSDTRIGRVTDIKTIENDSGFMQILVVGRKGAVYLDENGSQLKFVPFEAGKNGKGLGYVQAIEGEQLTFLNRGGGWGPVSLLDENGKKKWEFDKTPNDVAMLDVNSDGEKDLIVGTNASGGLYAFKQNGEELWRKDATNVFSVGVFEEDNIQYIIHSNKGQLVVRLVEGEIVERLKLPFNSFEIGKYSNTNVIIGSGQDKLWALDKQGNEINSFRLLRTGYSVKLESTNLIPNGKAVVQTLRHRTHNTEFYLFDQNDSLVFHEVFEATDAVVEEVSKAEGTYLLLGGFDGTVRIIRKS